jgi:hypothetical protein
MNGQSETLTTLCMQDTTRDKQNKNKTQKTKSATIMNEQH